MANFFDQFDGAAPDSQSDAPVRITVNPQPRYADAISSIESGGNYRSIGPVTRDGDRAVGKYQIMGKNVGPWTEEILGKRLTPMQFAASPDAQEAVFQGKFGSYVDKYGPEGAARAWFAGEKGMNEPNRKDVLGTSVSDYSRKFTKALGPQMAQAPANQPQPQTANTPATGNFFDQFDNQSNGPVSERFAEAPSPDNAAKLKAGLEQRAADLTTGERVSPAASMAIEHGNLLSAASQGTTPNVGAYNGKLLSTETHQDEMGNLYYRDPQTGKIVPTDNSKHVALRDPADNTIKVYARDAATNEGPVTGVARVLAPGLGAGAPTARAALAATNKVVPAASDIFSTAKPYYRAFQKEAQGIEVPAPTASGIVERIKGALEKGKVPEHLAPEVYRSVEQISKGVAAKELPHWQRIEAEMNNLPTAGASGKDIAVDHLRDVKELIGQSFKSSDSRVRQAASIATREINKIIGEVSTTAGGNLKTADDIYSAANSVRKFDSLTARAGAMETRKLYRGNVGKKMREYLSSLVAKADDVLLKDPKASTKSATGFSNDEIEAFREYVGARKGLRYAAEASPTKGIMRTFMEVAAVTAAGPSALAIPAVGYSANLLARALDAKQLGRIRELIAKRSPAYAEAVSKAVTRFEKAQIEFASQPTPNRLAAMISASRALSSGLTRDGVHITSGQLLKQVAGQPPAAAEEQ